MALKLQYHQILCMALLLVMLASHVSSSRPFDQKLLMHEKHERWIAHHGRVYKDAAEKAMRFEIFKDNVKRIEAFNNNGSNKYTQHVNIFSDRTLEEFRATHTNYYTASSDFSVNSFSPAASPSGSNTLPDDMPNSLDWREQGAVTDVKDQGSCGCCWAFSAVGAIEGRNQIATGQLVSFSEQELVDCTTNNNHGCHGGYMDSAFQFVQDNGGITTENSYPYTATSGNTCQAQSVSNAVQISGYQGIPQNDESALLQAVSQGPVSIGIDSGDFGFMHYQSGVFSSGQCGSTITHAVTLVGYGTTDGGDDYWLLKNSWGTSWGEAGYMRIQRNSGVEGGMCGITLMASYPLL